MAKDQNNGAGGRKPMAEQSAVGGRRTSVGLDNFYEKLRYQSGLKKKCKRKEIETRLSAAYSGSKL